jgi:predicted TPR repeat methyltransferase
MMKKLPEVNISHEKLYDLLTGQVKSQLLLTSIELKIFNHLSEPISAEAVAEAMDLHPANTRIFLDGLASIDLLVKKDGLYQNAPVAQALLIDGSQTFLGEMFTMQEQMWNSGLNMLSSLVKEGPPQASQEDDFDSEGMWAEFAVSMANHERAGLAQLAVKIISELPEFPSFRKMMDLGGGPGIVGIAVVGAHPNMKGVIFDQPSIIKITANFIKEYEIEDRVSTIGGDYNTDSIGEGYDLIWACNSLNFGKANMDALMKKIYDSLNPGGVFVSLCEGLTHERTRSEFVVLSMLSFALMGQDITFDRGFIADSMIRTGFKSVRSCPLEASWGMADLDIGRK